jgi:monoamine oxidase
VRFEPALEGAQAEAVRALPYSEATFAVIEAEAPFWESDGLPLAMWTDGLISLLYPVPSESGGPRQLLAYINGNSDRKLRRTPPSEASSILERELRERYALRRCNRGPTTRAHAGHMRSSLQGRFVPSGR